MEPKKDITISLIIPVYKVSPYIERCMKSVIKQTYDHFECILVDDASPDDSIAKCERMMADYQGNIQFRIIHHEQNRGLSAARNTGTDAATGDYILYVDSDDQMSNDCVEKLMAPIVADPSVEMVYGGSMTFSDGGQMHLAEAFKRKREEFTTQETVRSYYLDRKGAFIHAAWNKLTSRAFINAHQLRFREGLLWEDALWTFLEMKYLSHLVSIPDITYFYYQRPDSITYGTDKATTFVHKNIVSDEISHHFTPGDEGREAAHYLNDFCYYYLRQPKSRELRATARRFRRALSWRRYPKEKLLLWAANLLPHSHRGRELYKKLKKRLQQ